VGTWIYRISVNTCIDFIRKKKSNPDLSSIARINNEQIIDDNENIEKNYFKDERLTILHRCINRLSVIERTLISLYLEELKYSEIAEIIGISEKNVSVRISRIKKKMNKMLR
jgi:RNA polymerase sigma-70 factor (ECF subfamily)